MNQTHDRAGVLKAGSGTILAPSTPAPGEFVIEVHRLTNSPTCIKAFATVTVGRFRIHRLMVTANDFGYVRVHWPQEHRPLIDCLDRDLQRRLFEAIRTDYHRQVQADARPGRDRR